MSQVITAQDVTDYMGLNVPDTGTSQYKSTNINNLILTAQAAIERRTHRYLADHPAQTWICPATMLRAQVPIPGFRNFTTVTWGGSVQTVGFQAGDGASCWAIPDELMTGTYVALQFRAWRADSDAPWWLADRLWFDKLLDSPYYPGNWGGGYAWTSMPDDLVIVGDAGYVAGTEPPEFLHAVLIAAAWYLERPAAILADSAITPAGGIISYSKFPPEVEDFIANYSLGLQVAGL